MGLFGGQLSNVVEWQEQRDDVIFWKWHNDEIKRGSKLIIRPGQDAIFMFNGKIEGVFTDEGSFDIESEIVPFLSTLKGFKFGFNSGMRAEVLFINTREFTVKWGTKNAISLQAPGLPGGMPVRAFGNFQFKVADYQALIDKIAGIKDDYRVADVQTRVLSVVDQLLMKWISREGKDIFNLQANAAEISGGICTDLDMQMQLLGIGITGFQIQSVSYPEEVQEMQKKAAAQSMMGDLGRYQQMAMADALTKPGGNAAGQTAASMAGMQMGMMMGHQMAEQMAGQRKQGQSAAAGTGPKFCPNCGTPVNGAKFCSNCGQKLI